MEEDLKRIECLIERCNQCKLNACITCDICWSEVQAIEKLIKGYRELEESKITRERVNDIQEETKRIVDKNYIPKLKVKEKIECKIEELFEEMEECNTYDEEDNEEKRQLTDMIVLLKEVLKELMEDK